MNKIYESDIEQMVIETLASQGYAYLSPEQQEEERPDLAEVVLKNEEWLASHLLVHFHFTPTSASWLNMVQIWFGIFSHCQRHPLGKSLNGASFGSRKDLKAQYLVV